MSRFSDYVKATLVKDMDELRDPVFASKTDTIAEAVDRMAAARTGCVLIVDDERKLLGIFTERDVVMKVLASKASLSEPLEKFMTPNPDAASITDNLAEVLRQMAKYRRRNLPIVENGRAVKVLSSRSVIRHFAELFPAEILNLPPHPDQVYDSQDGA